MISWFHFSPLITIILGDFNSRSTSWWVNDKTAIQGTCLATFTNFHDSQQLISGYTHILPNSMSCIDLIFTDQSSLVVDCGIYLALLGNCHHSLSNSNYFTSAKKCQCESCVIDFISAKMKFALAIFKKLSFSKYLIKRCCKQLLFVVADYTNRSFNGVMITGRLSINKLINFKAFKKNNCSKFSKVYHLQKCIRYTFCYYHC